ncbi:hypothetical protein HU147_00490 [Planomicrobium chinense]|uniref:hypothetical protein n=1 Tax=Planococcus chinensis TaxID=272917 RepID=UPI001CC34ED0|nr:hypothetical protein [Planococcus chinensis]MBZ5199679.1 hypothetical protein [Planococcus chinensis]
MTKHSNPIKFIIRALKEGSEIFRVRNGRAYIIKVFEEAVVCALNGEKTFDDVENFWVNMYLMKPAVFQKMLTIKEVEIFQVAESVEKKKES